MIDDFLQTFQTLADDLWFKRAKSISIFLSKIITFEKVKEIDSVKNITKNSVFVKNFVDVMDDVSKMNVTKMNTGGLVFKTISKNKKLASFLTKNASLLENSVRQIAKWGDNSNPLKTMLKKYGKGINQLGKVFGYIDVGYKFYKNYQTTKSFTKAVLGTGIDVIADLNAIDGFVIGSRFGVAGAVGGLVLGGIVQVTNFLNPNLKDRIKNKLFGKKEVKNEKLLREDKFVLSLEVIEQRLQFYQKLVLKLESVISVLETFQNNYQHLISGNTATITMQGLQANINRAQHILSEHIRPTFTELKTVQQDATLLSKQFSKLQNFNRRTIALNKSELTQIENKLKYLISDYYMITASNVLDSNMHRETKRIQNQIYTEKQKVTILKNMVDQIERKKF